MSDQIDDVVGGIAGGLGASEHEELLRLRAESRDRKISDTVKAMGSSRADTLRKRIALRRIDIKEKAPDVDLVAYEAIHKLKNPSGDSKQKTYVSDNEIAAYKALDPGFTRAVSLDVVTAKVAELKAAGELTGDGDVTQEEDAE